MQAQARTPCRTPAAGKTGVTNIPTWKFEMLREHILDLVGGASEGGFAFSELNSAVADRLSDDEKANLGSIGWHTTTVKLEMEVAGDIVRAEGVSPQRLLLGSAAT